MCYLGGIWLVMDKITDELERFIEGSSYSLHNILSQHFPKETEENHKKKTVRITSNSAKI
jgi:hypothetical protein